MEVSVGTYNCAVTIDELKAAVGYDDNQSDVLDELIRKGYAAQQLCESYLRYYFTTRTATIEFYKADDFDEDERTLLFPYAPVNSITSVTAKDTTNNETTLTADTTYYLRGLKRQELYIPTSFTTGVNTELYSWKVVANIGLSTVPEIVKEAILKLVVEWYNNKGNYIPVLTDQVKMMLDTQFDKGWL